MKGQARNIWKGAQTTKQHFFVFFFFYLNFSLLTFESTTQLFGIFFSIICLNI